MTAVARLLRLAASSVVPGGGFLLGEWSPATALALYWIENIVSSLAMAGRIALHRRWTGRAGHDRGQLNATYSVSTGGSSHTREFRSFLGEFFLTSISFNIAHGIFLAAVLGFMVERPDASALRQGAIGIVALQLRGVLASHAHQGGCAGGAGRTGQAAKATPKVDAWVTSRRSRSRDSDSGRRRGEIAGRLD